MKKRRVGDLYVELGLLTPTQRDEVLRHAKKAGKSFLQAVLELKAVSKETLKESFGEDFQTRVVALDPHSLPVSTKYLYSPDCLMSYGFIPLGFQMVNSQYTALVGMLTPSDLGTIELLSQKIRHPIKTVLITSIDLKEILERIYKVDFKVVLQKKKRILHPLLLRELKKNRKRVKSGKTLKYKHELQLCETKPSSKKREKTLILEEVDSGGDPKKLLLPAALAYRVLPPLLSAPTSEKSLSNIEILQIGDRRNRKRNSSQNTLLIGIKLEAPSSNSKTRKRGTLRQFSVDNFSSDGMFLKGNRIDDLEIGKTYEILLSTKIKDYPFHVSMLAKVMRIEKETDHKKELGIGLKVLEMKEDDRMLWDRLINSPNKKAA